MDNEIQNWQTYDFTDVKRLKSKNIVYEKLIFIGKIFVFILVFAFLGFLLYLIKQDNFEFTLVSDATDNVCFFDKGIIKSVR